MQYHIAVIAERNRLYQRLTMARVPEVGVFWFVQQTMQLPTLLRSSVPIQLGKTYGVYVDGPDDHVGGWRVVSRLMPFLRDSDVYDWPRGRVLFNNALKLFEVDLSPQLGEPQFTKILEEFRLPEAFTKFSYDPHYAAARFTIGPDSPAPSNLVK